jgi:hypothetical protein
MNYSDYQDKDYPIGSGLLKLPVKPLLNSACSVLDAMERIGCCRDIEFKNFGFNTTKVEPILG